MHGRIRHERLDRSYLGQSLIEKRRTTFSSNWEIGPSKAPFRHRLPQKVIEPTENTAPPEGVSKYTISPRDRSSIGSPFDAGHVRRAILPAR